MLPDEVLLAIFDFYVGEVPIGEWRMLVHVCQRWRSVTFGSPRRLELQLVCRARTPARDTLDVWPALPLFIRCDSDYPTESADNIITVLERSDRVCQVDLKGFPSSHLENLSAAMQQPFPELTRLALRSYDEAVSVLPLPDSFLGCSTPRLKYLWLDNIPFPGLPKLLLSAIHLTNLCLFNIPHSGYFSPEALLTALFTLTSLKELWLEFQSPLYLPDWESRRPSPPTRTVLSVLSWFSFKGVSEYFDDLVARIDAPQLDKLFITFFNDVEFNTPQIIQFISHIPTLKGLEQARVSFENSAAWVELTSYRSNCGKIKVEVSCRALDWQVSALGQVCTSCLPPLSALEDLSIYGNVSWRPDPHNNTETAQWLELLRPFSDVKVLYLSEKLASYIAPALQELIGGRTTEVLPALQNLYLDGLQPSGPVQVGIRQFVTARQATDHPLAVARWEKHWNCV